LKGLVGALRSEVPDLKWKLQEQKKELFSTLGQLQMTENDLTAEKTSLINVETKLRIRAETTLPPQVEMATLKKN